MGGRRNSIRRLEPKLVRLQDQLSTGSIARQSVLADAPIAYWRLDDVGNSAARDFSGIKAHFQAGSGQ